MLENAIVYIHVYGTPDYEDEIDWETTDFINQHSETKEDAEVLIKQINEDVRDNMYGECAFRYLHYEN